MDDEFYQGIFNFQITIIDFIMRKYAAERHEQALSGVRIFTVSLAKLRFIALFAMPQSMLKQAWEASFQAAELKRKGFHQDKKNASAPLLRTGKR